VARPNRADIIKDYHCYLPSTKSEECSFRDRRSGNVCGQPSDPASHGFIGRFCAGHWPICKLCNNRLPTFNTGRLQYHCQCKAVRELYETANAEGRQRKMWKELIGEAFKPVGIEVGWNVFSATQYGMGLHMKDASNPDNHVWMGTCVLEIGEDTISVRDNLGYNPHGDIPIADPELGGKIVSHALHLLSTIHLRPHLQTLQNTQMVLHVVQPWVAKLGLMASDDPKYIECIKRHRESMEAAAKATDELNTYMVSLAQKLGDRAQQGINQPLDGSAAVPGI
jgi:hypothetical protein